MPAYAENFQILDCLSDKLDAQFDFIFAVAVVHMLVSEADRMVSFGTFTKELRDHRPEILEQGITEALPDFNSLMYAVVKRA